MLNAMSNPTMNPARVSAWLAIYWVSSLWITSLGADVSISRIGQSLVHDRAQPQNVSKPLNLRSHQDDAITSFNGHQYCVFYSYANANTAQRFVSIARRALPSGNWETIVLTDYTQTRNDPHNVIAIGICPGDGTIHLAFDHHNEDLNYRVSVEGLATNPGSHAWVANKFNPVRDSLPGLSSSVTTGFTYARFAPKPDGDLLLIRRKGSAIAGKSMIYTYDQDDHDWSSHGVYIDGTQVLYTNDAGNDTKLNGYLNGITYGGNRLHASWVWRTEGQTSNQNFDFMYAYSDDHGITWRNNAGQIAGTANSDAITYDNEPPVKVLDYPEGTGLVNQAGQAVDAAGRVHVVQRKNGKFLHIHRDTSGTWNQNLTTIDGGRHKLTTDLSGNAYLITSSARIYAATPENDFDDWSLVYSADSGNFAGEPLFDEERMRNEGILTLLVAEPGSSQNLHTLDLQISPVSTGPIPQDVDLQSWEDPTTWDPDGAPQFSRHYTTTMRLRTPGTTATFPGASLTLFDGGQLQLRNTGADVATVDSLVLDGGNIYAGTGSNVTSTLDGGIDVTSDSDLRGYWSGTSGRSLHINSQIEGNATLTSTASDPASSHQLLITNPANTFAGTWISEAGILEFQSPESIGSGSIEVKEHGSLIIHGEWDGTATGSTLTVADSPEAQVQLGANHWTVAALNLGGIAMPNGHYTASGLNLIASHPVFSGSGSIRVGPPLSALLISQPEDASVRENPDVVDQSSSTTLLGTGGSSPWVDRCTVFVFRLPDLGDSADPFLTSALTFNYQSKQGDLYDNDLYAVRVSTSPEVLASDYYGQTSIPDPGDAIRLQSNILTNSTPFGLVETSATGNEALRAFLNDAYDGGSGIGKYVFLRLNSADPKDGIDRATLTMSEGGQQSPVDTRPRISFTAEAGDSPLEIWRFDHFGTTAGLGPADDESDANGDGESNLLEFATGQDPHASTLAKTALTDAGTSLTFTFDRSLHAVAEGLTFTVVWSDTLLGDSWSDEGVSYSVADESGGLHHIEASVPPGPLGRRFVRLQVSSPQPSN